jgi:hypothetical protein
LKPKIPNRISSTILLNAVMERYHADDECKCDSCSRERSKLAYDLSIQSREENCPERASKWLDKQEIEKKQSAEKPKFTISEHYKGVDLRVDGSPRSVRDSLIFRQYPKWFEDTNE